MSAKSTLKSMNSATQARAHRSLDLHHRFLLAAVTDASLLDDIPNGVNLSLVPTDGPTLAVQEIELGLTALHQEQARSPGGSAKTAGDRSETRCWVETYRIHMGWLDPLG